MKSGSLNFLEPCGPVQACNGFALSLLLPLHKMIENMHMNAPKVFIFIKILQFMSTANVGNNHYSHLYVYLFVCPFSIQYGLWKLLNYMTSICYSSSFWWAVFVCKGYVMVQLVETPRYKPEDHGFDSRWGFWNFSLTWSSWLHYGPGVNPAYNRNEYQGCFLGCKGGNCIWLATFPPSCANCPEILRALTAWSLKGLPRPIWELLYLYLYRYWAQLLEGNCEVTLFGDGGHCISKDIIGSYKNYYMISSLKYAVRMTCSSMEYIIIKVRQ